MTPLYSLAWLPYSDWTQIYTPSELSVLREETNPGTGEKNLHSRGDYEPAFEQSVGIAHTKKTRVF